MNKIIRNTQTSYDRVAVEYGERFKDEMDDKPFDRDCLNRLAREVDRLGPLCDMGCGPGQVARYLHRLGVKTLGVDLSANMVAEAQRLTRRSIFIRGICYLCLMRIIRGAASRLSIASFTSRANKSWIRCAEMKRVLKPGGILLITFHIGTEVKHLDDWWEKPVNLDFAFYLPTEMETWLKEAGFVLEETLLREPIAEVEVAYPKGIYIRKEK